MTQTELKRDQAREDEVAKKKGKIPEFTEDEVQAAIDSL